MRSGPLTLLAAVLASTVVACGAGSSGATAPPVAASPTGAYRGSGTFTPPRAEPPLVLTDYLGHPFDLSQAHGKAVLVTFLYTHCPDVCPIIASSLRAAQIQLGAAADRLVLVAVSTDPAGDTPAAVAAFLGARELDGGHMDYLLGSPAQLKVVQAQWMVAAAPDSSVPGTVNHTAVVYGISASGKLTTIYAANFKAADVVHDVPLLAGS